MPPKCQQCSSTPESRGDVMLSSLRRTHEKLESRSEKLKILSLEIERLKDKEAAAKRQLANLELGFEEKAAEIVQYESQELMEAFFSKLPREIRDLVYDHICAFAEYIQLPLLGQDFFRDESIMWPDSQLLNPNYLGETLATELYETYWSKNRFEVTVGLNNGAQDDALEIFLSAGAIPHPTRPLHKNYLPPWKKIRHLKVNVGCEEWEFGKRYHKEGMRDYYSSHLTDGLTFAQAAMAALEEQLDALHQYSREKTHVEIVVNTRFAQMASAVQLRNSERHLVNILEGLRVCVCEMMHSGVYVTVTLSNTGFLRERLGLQTWDITSRFILTAEEWHNEKVHNSTQNMRTAYLVEPAAATYHFIPRSALDDMEGFRELLLRRWKVRYALPWIEGA